MRGAAGRKPVPLMGEACFVQRLRVVDFRNLARLDLDAGCRPIVVTGDNGAGKTNLLEAVSMVAPGRGLRRARPQEQARIGGSGQWGIQLEIDGPDGPHTVATGIDPDGERRRIRVDGSDLARREDLAAIASVLWLTPAEDRLFVESPAERRRFLDRLIAADDPDYARLLGRYERQVRERGTVLRSGGSDPIWLRTLENSLAADAVAITAIRLDRVAMLDGIAGVLDLPFPRVRLSLSGEVEQLLGDRPALDVEEELQRRLFASRGLDRELGGASVGPQRSDLIATDAETAVPARSCSTGRQKALLLSIVLAELRRRREQAGLVPILLLDEAVAHLDQRRRDALFDTITAEPAQIWLTGTDTAPFSGLGERARFLQLHQGDIVHHG